MSDAVRERLWATAPVAGITAQLAAHGLSAPLGAPSTKHAIGVSAAALVIAAAAGVIARAPYPHAMIIMAGLSMALGLTLGAVSGFWAAGLAAALGAGASTLLLFRRLPRLLPLAMEGASGRHRRLRWLWGLLAVASVLTYARFSAFMEDLDFRAGAALPTKPPSHMCLAAYLHAAELAGRDPAAVYRPEHYAPSQATEIEGMQPFMRDPYMYPPPALLPARLAITLSQQLSTIRTVWFALQGLFFVAVSLALARAFAPARGAIYVWLWPALAMAWPTLYNFEFGQAHLFTLALAVAGMFAFARGRRVLGAAFLGASIAVKIFPGLLVLYLALRRRWADALAATLATLGWLLLAVPVMGVEIYASFLGDHLPRLASGEAFATFIEHVEFDTPHLSPQALVFTLRALGVPGMGSATATALAALYTVVVLAAAAVASRRPDHPLVWLALLALGASRSPYAPAAYVMVGTLWLTVALAAQVHTRTRLACGVLVSGLFLQTAPLLGYLPPFWSWPILTGIATPIMMALVVALSLFCLARAPYGVP